MHKFLTKIYGEIYTLKGQHRLDTINERWENVILSLAIVENAYRDKYPNSTITFDQWLTGGVKGLGKGDSRRKYIHALLLPIDQYHNVHQINKSGDAYYQSKLDAGLIAPFTEKELKKRRRDLANWEDMVFQPKYKKGEMNFNTWIDSKIVGDRSSFNERGYGLNPEKLHLMEQGKHEMRESLTKAGLTPIEIDAALRYREVNADAKWQAGSEKNDL